MALTLTLPQTGFSSPSEEVQKDYTVVSGEWTVGRIHVTLRSGPRLIDLWCAF